MVSRHEHKGTLELRIRTLDLRGDAVRLIREPRIMTEQCLYDLYTAGRGSIITKTNILCPGDVFFSRVGEDTGVFVYCETAKVLPPEGYTYRLRLLTDAETRRHFRLVSV